MFGNGNYSDWLFSIVKVNIKSSVEPYKFKIQENKCGEHISIIQDYFPINLYNAHPSKRLITRTIDYACPKNYNWYNDMMFLRVE